LAQLKQFIQSVPKASEKQGKNETCGFGVENKEASDEPNQEVKGMQK